MQLSQFSVQLLRMVSFSVTTSYRYGTLPESQGNASSREEKWNVPPDNIPDQNLIILGRSSSRTNSRLAAHIIRKPSFVLYIFQVVEKLPKQNHPILEIGLDENDW